MLETAAEEPFRLRAVKHPTISPQFDSDAQGKPVLEGLLAGHFLLRSANPDFFVDYYAEARDAREPSGKIVWLQLKSTARVADNARHIKVQLTRKALRYYASKATSPVFVVAVDVARKRACYLFAQEWIANFLGGVASGPDKARVSVDVPVANDLSDIPTFIGACNRAIISTRDKFPGSPEAAVKHAVAELSQLDPRFNVALSMRPEGRHYHLSARTPTDINFTFGPEKAQEAARQFQEAVDFGRSVNLTDVRLKAHGSPLFEHVLSGGLAKLEWGPAREVSCSVELSCAAAGHQFSFQLPATFGAGRAGFSLTTTADDFPFRIQDNIRLRGVGEAPESNMALHFSTRAWEGKPISYLPWFEPTLAFVRATRAAHPVRFTLILKGSTVFSGTLTATWRRRDGDMLWWFDRIKDICDLATALHSRAALPIVEYISPKSMKGHTFALRLLREGRAPVESVQMTCDGSAPLDAFWTGVLADIEAGRMCIRNLRGGSPHSFTFLGEPASLGRVTFGPCDVQISRVRDNDNAFELRGAGGATLEMTLHRDAEAAPW